MIIKAADYNVTPNCPIEKQLSDLSEPFYADLLLLRLRISVFRRSAFNHICNVNVFITA